MTTNPSRNKSFLKFLASSAACALTGEQGTKLLEKATSGIPFVGLAIPVIGAVVNSIAGNLASEHYGKIVNLDHLLTWIDTDDPDQMNHDLEKMLYRSAISAFLLVQKTYVREMENDELRWLDFTAKQKRAYFSALKVFFKTVQKELIGEHITLYLKVETTDIADPGSIVAILADHLRGLVCTEFDASETELFVSYFIQKMPICLNLAINEELKTNERVFRAYQLCIAEDIKARQIELKVGIDEVLTEVRAGNRDLFPRDFIIAELSRVSENLFHGFSMEAEQLKDMVASTLLELESSIIEKIVQDGVHTRSELTLNFNTVIDNIFNVKLQIEELRTFVEQKFQESKEDIKDLTQKLKTEVKPIGKFLGGHRWHYDEFIGRTPLLKKILRHFESYHKPVCLFGIGGIGKSTVAKKLVEALHEQYDHILWLEIKLSGYIGVESQRPLDFENAIRQAFIGLHNDLHIEYKESQTVQERFELVTAKLRNLGGSNLLIIDNCEPAIHKLRAMIPGLPYWHVLLTSRMKIDGYHNESIGTLEKTEAKKLFSVLLAHEEISSDIDDLLEEIGCHTLMIELVAKTLNETPGLSVKLFHAKLMDEQLDQVKKRNITLEHAESEVTLFEHLLFTFNTANLSEREKDMLRIMYYILPGEHPYNCFLEMGLNEANEIDDILWSLHRKGWISFNSDQSSFELHRLIRKVVYYELKPTVMDALFQATYLNYEYYQAVFLERFALEEPFSYLLSALKESELAQTDIAIMMSHLGNIYMESSRVEAAEQLYLAGIKVLTDLESTEPDGRMKLLATMYGQLGNLYFKTNDLTKAEFFYEKGKPILDALPDSIGLLNTIIVNLGQIYRVTGRSIKAEECYLQVLEYQRTVFDESNDSSVYELGSILLKLGSFYHAIGRYTLAGQLLSESKSYILDLHSRNPKEYTLILAEILELQALLNNSLGRYEEAEDAINEAKDIYLELAKLNAEVFLPMIAKADADLAGTLKSLGRIQEAEVAYERALSSFEHLICQSQSVYINSYVIVIHNLGNIYLVTDRLSLAEQYFVKARDICLELQAKSSRMYITELAASTQCFVKLYIESHQFERAESMIEETLTMIKKAIKADGDDFANDIASLHLLLAKISQSQNLMPKAIERYQRYLTMAKDEVENAPEKFPRDLIDACTQLGELQLQFDLYEEAAMTYHEIINAADRIPGDLSIYALEAVGNAYKQMGVIYPKLGESMQEERSMLSLLTVFSKLIELKPEMHTPNLGILQFSLGRYYLTAERWTEAEQYFLDCQQTYLHLMLSDRKSYTNQFANACLQSARLYEALDRTEEAEAAYLQMKSVYMDFLKLDDVETDGMLENLALLVSSLANLYVETKDNLKAEAALLETKARYEVLLNKSPDYSWQYGSACFNLARFYATIDQDENCLESCAEGMHVMLFKTEVDERDQALIGSFKSLLDNLEMDFDKFIDMVKNGEHRN